MTSQTFEAQFREVLQHSRHFTEGDRWPKSSDFLYQFFLDLPDRSFRADLTGNVEGFFLLHPIPDWRSQRISQQFPKTAGGGLRAGLCGRARPLWSRKETARAWTAQCSLLGISHGSMVNYTNRVSMIASGGSSMGHEIRLARPPGTSYDRRTLRRAWGFRAGAGARRPARDPATNINAYISLAGQLETNRFQFGFLLLPAAGPDRLLLLTATWCDRASKHF
ncbi:hypothetical protein R1sor_001147 [Riccia sorocarpa]|uniref:Uncharacterized protein n=1 Tax=Riccia sorocarpa TaxID=122646 RepID=A0ABD3GYD5_9MARC